MTHADPVTPEMHRAVLLRDRMCFLYMLDPKHVCYTLSGRQHDSHDLIFMTVDHFWLHPGGTKGKRAPSDLEHLVAMCAHENDRPPSAITRQRERDYIEDLYPGARLREEALHAL